MSDNTNGNVNQSGANAASSMHTISNCFRMSLGQFVAVRQVVVATKLFEIWLRSSPRVAFLHFVEITSCYMILFKIYQMIEIFWMPNAL